MALKEYQTSLSLDTLYEVTLRGGVSGRGNTLSPSIWSNDVISIYASNSATEPAALVNMTLGVNETNVEGMLTFGDGVSAIPRYIAITGSATEVIVAGLEVTSLGAIS